MYDPILKLFPELFVSSKTSGKFLMNSAFNQIRNDGGQICVAQLQAGVCIDFDQFRREVAFHHKIKAVDFEATLYFSRIHISGARCFQRNPDPFLDLRDQIVNLQRSPRLGGRSIHRFALATIVAPQGLNVIIVCRLVLFRNRDGL